MAIEICIGEKQIEKFCKNLLSSQFNYEDLVVIDFVIDSSQIDIENEYYQEKEALKRKVCEAIKIMEEDREACDD